MSVNTNVPTERMHGLATLAASLLIPVPLLVSSITKGVLFAANPAKVDLTNGLAYLRELLGLGFGSLGLILLVIGIVFVVARRAGTSLRLPWIVLGTQVIIGLVTLAFTALSNNAHDSYVTLISG